MALSRCGARARAARRCGWEAGHSWSQVTPQRLGRRGGGAPSRCGRPQAAGAGSPPEPAVAAGAAVTPEPAGAREPEADREPTPRPTRTGKTGPLRARQAADARELFEEARNEWRAGRIAEAAQRYQQLLGTYPRDPRAGLAAFELGRLRMDRLDDLRGAVQALEQAVALAPGAALREDALARLVTASAAVHDPDRCSRARARYLADYPGGVHRRTVAAASCQ